LRGLYCENLTELGEHEPGRDTNIQPFREQGYRAPNATRMKRFDLLIVEHLHDPFPEQVRRGDLVIRMERAA